MAYRINITKAHRRAMDVLFSDRENLDKLTWDALRDLRDRIARAYDEKKMAGFSPQAFLAIAEEHLGDRLGLPPESTRTQSWYGRLGAQIAAIGLDEATSHQLCEYVAGWAQRSVSVSTLLAKAHEWLAAAEGKRVAAEREPFVSTAAEKGFFDE